MQSKKQIYIISDSKTCVAKKVTDRCLNRSTPYRRTFAAIITNSASVCLNNITKKIAFSFRKAFHYASYRRRHKPIRQYFVVKLFSPAPRFSFEQRSSKTVHTCETRPNLQLSRRYEDRTMGTARTGFRNSDQK